MENKTYYQVITDDTYKIIASGFYTYEDAYDWAYDHDYGQFEDDGGWMVIPYQE